MAPGILPLATSLRMKSLTRANPSLEKCCAPSPADPARETSMQLAPARASTRASTASLRNAARSVLHGFIDQLFQRPLDALAFARGLLQQHEEHVLLAVDHEVTAAGAVPFQFTEIARRRRLGIAWICSHRQPKAESEAIAGEIEKVPSNARAGTNLIGRHQLERLGFEIGLAFERAAIEQHLHKARIVRHGRDHAAGGGFPLLDLGRIVLAANPEVTIVRDRLRHQLLFLWISDK